MLGRISSRIFALVCVLAAILAAFVSISFLSFLVETVVESFNLYALFQWEPWPSLLLIALACAAAASTVALMRRARQRAKQLAASAETSASSRLSRVDVLMIDPTEQGMIDLFPNQRFAQGVAAGGAILNLLNLLAALVFTPDHFFAVLISLAIAVGVFLMMATAVFRLPQGLARFITAIYLTLGLFLPFGALAALADTDIFRFLSFCLLGFACWALGRSWWSLAELRDSDRFLLRAPYKAVLSKSALAAFTGLPPIFAFMRERKHEALAIAVLASLFFCVAFVVPVMGASTVYAFPRAMILPPYFVLERKLSLDLTVLIIMAFTVPICVVAGNALLNTARSRMRLSINELTTVDPRPPILFLRAFYDDQVALGEPRHRWIGKLLALGQRPVPLDQLLLEEATLYGPVVALGNPRDRFPPYGAARGYFQNKDWQQAVSDLARDALAIVLCLDETESVWWEIGHIDANNYLHKTLFVLPPKYIDAQSNRAIAKRLMQHLRVTDEDTRADLAADFEQGNTIGICTGDDERVKVTKSASFSRFAYLVLVRWFFRKRFGIEMRPAT